jgi:hypothetical protein
MKILMNLTGRAVIILRLVAICSFALILVAVTLTIQAGAQAFEITSNDITQITHQSDEIKKVKHQSDENQVLVKTLFNSNHKYNYPITTDKKVVRDFVLFSYSRLSNDIVSGSGQYLETLYSLLGVDMIDRANVRQDFVRILISNQRIPAFAIEVADYGQSK